MVFSACHIWTLFTCYLHMYMSSTHYLDICILCTHYLQWSLIYSFLTDNADVIHVISSTLYISYHVQLSFCTLSAQMHIVYVICMLCAYGHIICLSFLTLLVYPIIHNLIPHIAYTHTYCQCHLYIVYRSICYVHLIFTAVIYICTCHPHIIWAYAYYTHTTYSDS